MAPMVSDILVNTDSSTGTMLVSGHNLNQSYLTVNQTLIYSLTPEQRGRHFADGIPNAFSWIKTCALQ